MDKPTVKQIEEYMASLNIPDEQRFTQGLNGMSHKDLPFQLYTTPLSEDYDVVSKPKHYMLFEDKGIEVRDVIERLLKKVQDESKGMTPHYKEASLFESDYVQLMQYLMRFMDKNGVEDLKKARWYLDKMIEAY